MQKKLAAKPRRRTATKATQKVSEEVVEEVIKKGGSAATSSLTGNEKAEQATISLRLYPAMLQQVQKIVERQPIKTSRNTWIVQAILEKMEREVISK